MRLYPDVLLASCFAAAGYGSTLPGKKSFELPLQGPGPNGAGWKVNMTVSTPPQELSLIVDTGSAPLWVFAKDVVNVNEGMKACAHCSGG